MEKHPTFGVIRASRWSTGGKGLRLFGSPLPGHYTGVTLTIKEASRSFELGRERVSGADGDLLCEVTLSPSQWAELIMSTNQGEGVPCTVRYVQGDEEVRKEPPATASEPEWVRTEFASMLTERVALIVEQRAHLKAKMGRSVSQSLAKEIDDVLAMVQQDLERNAPWYVAQFACATDRLTRTAQAEVASLMGELAPRQRRERVSQMDTDAFQRLVEEEEEE